MDFVVALAAVNGLVVAGFKRNLCRLVTLCADRGEHLAGPAVITAATTGIPLLLFSRRAAGRAALGLVGIALLREEFLLGGAKRKSGAAVAAND